MLSNIWKKPTIQIHGSTILSMRFNPIIKTHGKLLIKNPIFIGNIKSPIFIGNIKSPVLIGNIKNPIFIGNIKSPVLAGNIESPIYVDTIFKSPRLLTLGKKKKKKLCYNYFLNINMAKTMAIVL